MNDVPPPTPSPSPPDATPANHVTPRLAQALDDYASLHGEDAAALGL